MFRRKPPANLSDREKELHPSWRRYTQKYQKKKGIVRDIWIGSGTVMLLVCSSVGAILTLTLMTTLLSLVILDETA